MAKRDDGQQKGVRHHAHLKKKCIYKEKKFAHRKQQILSTVVHGSNPTSLVLTRKKGKSGQY